MFRTLVDLPVITDGETVCCLAVLFSISRSRCSLLLKTKQQTTHSLRNKQKATTNIHIKKFKTKNQVLSFSRMCLVVVSFAVSDHKGFSL